MKQNEIILPEQVKHLIALLLDTKRDIYTRSTFRSQLEQIQRVINKAIVEYDKEYSKTTGRATDGTRTKSGLSEKNS